MAKTAKKPGTENTAKDYATRFGNLVRQHREARKLRQDDVVFATGVGRRFIIDLEAGKPSCQLGKALVVAAAVGLRPIDLMSQTNDDNAMLPDLPEIAEEPSRGRSRMAAHQRRVPALDPDAAIAAADATPRVRALGG